MSMSVRRALGATAAVGLAVVGLQVTGVGAAWAHTAAVSGSAVCASNGTYTVTWRITNSQTTATENARVKNPTPSGSTVGPTDLTIAKDSSGTVTQRDIDGSATRAGITVDAKWDDNFTKSGIGGSVHLDGTCGAKTLRTAVTPSADNGACVDYQVTRPSVAIPRQSGVSWKLDGRSVESGTRTVSAGVHKITASSTVWKLTGRTSWTYTLTSAAGNCSPPPSARPVSPDVKQAVCTGTGPSTPSLDLPKTEGITYKVSKQSPYSPGQTVKITATAKKGYQLGKLGGQWKASGDDRATRTLTFDDAPVCSGFANENETNSGAAVAAGSDVNNGGLAATGTRDFGPLAAIALAMLATGMVLVRRTRRA